MFIYSAFYLCSHPFCFCIKMSKSKLSCYVCSENCKTDCIKCETAKQGLKRLKTAVRREVLFMKCTPVHSELHSDFSQHEQDSVSNFILSQYHPTSKAALFTTGDGDCLFNAVSTLLVGDESMCVELKYRCCLEMVTNGRKIKNHAQFPRLELISPDYEKDCVDCAKPGSYSSVWRIMALANVLNIPIECVYPAINGYKHIAFRALNQKFRAPFADPDKQITIMWTHTVKPEPNTFAVSRKQKKEWTPNHFVALVDTPRHRDNTTSESDNDTADQVHVKTERTSKTAFASPNRFENLIIEETLTPESTEVEHEIQNGTVSTENSPEIHKETVSKEKSNSNRKQESFSPMLNQNLSTTVEENETSYHNNVGYSHEATLDTSTESSENSVIDTDIDNMDESLLEPQSVSFTPGVLGNKFMDIKETLSVHKGPHSVLNEIPVGRKDGYFFVINNSDNVEKRKDGKRSTVWDDCGAWEKGTTPVSYYVENAGKLVTILKRESKYGTMKQVKGKREFVSFEPQPTEENILEVHRLYQTLKRSPPGKEQFKRRVTWIEKCPANMLYIQTNIAVVEYVGKFPPLQYHGRVKNENGNVKYIRTKDSVMKKLKSRLKQNPMKTVERQMNREESDDLEKQRNDKLLRNLKYSINKEKKPPHEKNQNVADHVQAVEEMTKKGDFVKTVTHSEGLNFPLITLYTSQQIKDIKRFCCVEGGAVLGIDKTYNLGAFHVTPTVYKDMSVTRRDGKTHPICFGPTLIHTNSSTNSYRHFMHQIADNLTDEEITKLTIGSDEELAFKTAIKRCFPGCTHVLCTRHLKKNATHYMEATVGYNKTERDDILDDIFGTNGITEVKDIDTLNYKVGAIDVKIENYDQRVKEGDKTFKSYWESKMLPMLKTHIIEPSQSGRISPN